MGRRAGSRRAVERLRGIGSHPALEVFETARGHVRSDRKCQIGLHDVRYRKQVGHRVVTEVGIDVRLERNQRPGGEKQGRAVWLGLRDRLDPGASSRAGDDFR